jgi:predicted transcriptional regulator
MAQAATQAVTITLSTQTVQKVQMLAEKRSTSVSDLLAEQVEALIGTDEAYEKARQSALKRLQQGFHLGGGPYATRDELHDR